MLCNRAALAARTTAAVLVATALAFSWAQAAAASGPAANAGRMLIPSAGWDGRPIQEPHRHEGVRTSSTDRAIRGWSAGPVAYGTGFHSPGGSARVREVQRRLSRLGYHVGPDDGLFGRLTRASVAWFQVKHGLEVDGRATLETVRHLRARTGSNRATRNEPVAVSQDAPGAARPEAWEALNQLVGPRPAIGDDTPIARTRSGAETVLRVLLVVALVLLVALLSQGLSTRRSDRARAASVGRGTGEAPASEPQGTVAAKEERAPPRFASSDRIPPDRVPGRQRTGARHD